MSRILKQIRPLLAIAVMAIFCAANLNAQQKIQEIVTQLSQNEIDKGELVTYSVRRSPSTQKVTHVTLIVTFEKGSPWIDRILKAFNADAPKSTEFSRSKDNFHLIRFNKPNEKGEPNITATIYKRGGKWEFSYQARFNEN